MRKRIVILGAGFGGMYTALEAHRRAPSAEITLVDRNDFFLFTPLLHQIVSSTLRPDHLAHPIASLLPPGTRFIQSTVHAVDLDGHGVETESGRLPYDLLVIALGSVPNFYGMESVERNAFPFKWLPDTLRLREQFLGRFEAAAADPSRAPDLLRTVVTGAGCTGIEVVAEIHDWMNGPLLRRYPDIPKEAIDLQIVEALDHLLCPMDPELMKVAARQLVTREIDVRLETFVEEVRADSVLLRRGADRFEIPCGTVVWAAGIRPSPVAATAPNATGPGGKIVVTETLQLPDHPEVLAIGDIAATPRPGGGILPATAQVAVQQSVAAGKALAALLKGAEPEPFIYKPKGEVVAFGRSGALTEAFGTRFTGLPAWLLGRTVHLARLPDWGDRTSVAWEWAKQALKAGRL